MNKLEDEMPDMASKDIARQIDSELLDTIMIDILKDEGWIATKVNPAFTDIGMNIVPSRFDDWYSQTAEWIHLNATGDYKLLKGLWIFEKKQDAVMFTLKWA